MDILGIQQHKTNYSKIGEVRLVPVWQSVVEKQSPQGAPIDEPSHLRWWQRAQLHFIRKCEAISEVTVSNHDFMSRRMRNDRTGPANEVISDPFHFLLPSAWDVVLGSASPGGLLASAVGTGKTAVMVSHILEVATPECPALVVVPTQVEQQWVNEFERVCALEGRACTIFEKVGRKRVPDPDPAGITVWRCNNVVASWAKPPPYHVFLTTYSFVERRVMELQRNITSAVDDCINCINQRAVVQYVTRTRKFDMDVWAAEAGEYARKHGLHNVFHNRVWRVIVYDEIDDITKKDGRRTLLQMWKFLNRVPAKHVWGMTAAPSNFTQIARALRWRVVRDPLVYKDDGSPPLEAYNLFNSIYVNYAATLMAKRAIRYGKSVMPRISVRHKVLKLELTGDERRMLNYLRSMPHGVKRTRAELLLCTDVHAMIQQMAGEASTSTISTLEDFYNMLARHKQQDDDNAERRRELTARLEELEVMLGALDAEFERAQVQAQITAAQQQLGSMCRDVHGGNFNALKARVEEATNNPCPVCMEDIDGDTALTPCAHVFCTECLRTWLTAHAKCPMCRHCPIAWADVRVMTKVKDEPQPVTKQLYSTKLQYVYTQVRNILQSTQDKVILFCDYPDTLRTMRGVLEKEGIPTLHISGNIYVKRNNLDKFHKDGEERVLLLHTHNQNSGMDLFQANHIIFMNCFALGHTTVQQAVGRCVRLAQKKTVNVTFVTVPEVESVPDFDYFMESFLSSHENDQ